MAHFRLTGDVNYLPYGRSYLEPARKLFKQYVLIEDAMLIHRIGDLRSLFEGDTRLLEQFR